MTAPHSRAIPTTPSTRPIWAISWSPQAAVGKATTGSLPAPGSDAVVASDPRFDNGTRKTALYASKHSGFINFADVQADPVRSERIVGMDQFDRDLASGALPNFALVVPNQCDEMHGLHGPGVPADCDGADKAALIRRGDAYAGALVRRIKASPLWAGRERFAVVITFDEGSGKTREGCCAATEAAGLGGGPYPDHRDHQPRTARRKRRHALQSLLTAAHSGGRLRYRTTPAPRGRHGPGCDRHDPALRRQDTLTQRRASA